MRFLVNASTTPGNSNLPLATCAMNSPIPWLLWLLPLCLVFVAAPRGEVREGQTAAVTGAALEECRVWQTSGRGHGKSGPGTVVPGCWKSSTGAEFHTCRHKFSRRCFKPAPEALNAMLRGEPWTMQAVRRENQKWDVYEIKSADGYVLRSHADGGSAWGEWSRMGLLAAGIFAVLTAFVHVGFWVVAQDKSTQRSLRRP